jgi:hypothetical protein
VGYCHGVGVTMTFEHTNNELPFEEQSTFVHNKIDHASNIFMSKDFL